MQSHTCVSICLFYYAAVLARPSVCLSFVCSSACLSVYPVWARNLQNKKNRKIKIGINVPQGCQFSDKTVKGLGRRTSISPQQFGFMFTYGRWITRRLYGADCKLGLTIVRPNLLLTLETLGNWTAGRISCRHSAPTSSLVL